MRQQKKENSQGRLEGREKTMEERETLNEKDNT